jgi:hypothetical protein
MARTVNDIQQQIIATKNAQPELAALNSQSKRAIWNLWTFVIAACIAIFEQILDVFISDNESIIAQSYSGSILWLQKKVYEFQYSATNPQIIQLINGVPAYPIVDAALRIITACTIESTSVSYVTMKVAKGNPFVKLSNLELASINNYFLTIGITGIQYNVVSSDPDLLYLQAQIYFDGQYANIIKSQVVAAINNLLQSLAFSTVDGNIKVSDIEYAVKSVAGVKDIVINNMSARSAAQYFGSGTQIVLNNSVLYRQYKTVAGYIIQETTSGQTFNDTLTFIAQ